MPNQKFKMKGKGNISGHDTDLDIDVDDKYEAYSKPVPERTKFENGYITWFNAFGVRDKKTGKDTNVRYKVILQKLPEGKRLFYLYNNQPVELFPEDEGNGKVRFFLEIGDPPTGIYP